MSAIRTARQLAVTCARLASDKKAEDVVILDVGRLLALTDYFVIGTCTNPRQMRAIADDLARSFKPLGFRCGHQEGRPETNWLLLDFGDVVVHLFDADRRRFYDLEGLWGDVQRVSWRQRRRKPVDAADADGARAESEG